MSDLISRKTRLGHWRPHPEFALREDMRQYWASICQCWLDGLPSKCYRSISFVTLRLCVLVLGPRRFCFDFRHRWSAWKFLHTCYEPMQCSTADLFARCMRHVAASAEFLFFFLFFCFFFVGGGHQTASPGGSADCKGSLLQHPVLKNRFCLLELPHAMHRLMRVSQLTSRY